MDQKRDGSAPVTISRIAEAEIPAGVMHQLQALLRACFPGYPSRAYFKLPPHFRYLATAEDTGALMVKQIGQRTWPEGEVDLLGHLF